MLPVALGSCPAKIGSTYRDLKLALVPNTQYRTHKYACTYIYSKGFMYAYMTGLNGFNISGLKN
jgi:hypothetical protein